MFSQVSPNKGYIRIMRTEPITFLCICLQQNRGWYTPPQIFHLVQKVPRGHYLCVWSSVLFSSAIFSFLALDVGFTGFWLAEGSPKDPFVLCRAAGLCHEACCVPSSWVCVPSLDVGMLSATCFLTDMNLLKLYTLVSDLFCIQIVIYVWNGVTFTEVQFNSHTTIWKELCVLLSDIEEHQSPAALLESTQFFPSSTTWSLAFTTHSYH